jgi:hypothetical protein
MGGGFAGPTHQCPPPRLPRSSVRRRVTRKAIKRKRPNQGSVSDWPGSLPQAHTLARGAASSPPGCVTVRVMALGRVFLPLFALVCGAAGAGALSTAGLQDETDTWTETELARESFNDATWQDRWVVEGDGEFSARNGRLSVATLQATAWRREPLPADVSIELKAGVDLPADDNAANLNLLLHASSMARRIGLAARLDTRTITASRITYRRSPAVFRMAGRVCGGTRASGSSARNDRHGPRWAGRIESDC